MSHPGPHESAKFARRELRGLAIRLVVAFALTLILINIFFDITENLGTLQRVQTDDIILRYFIDLRTPGLTRLAITFTTMGNALTYSILIPVSALILYKLKRRWLISVEATFILISASLLNSVLKNWISRPRPSADLHIVSAESFSYPSGHAMSAMAFYGFLIYITVLYVKPPALKWILSLTLAVLITAIGASRVYLGVHYPSDVIAGFLAGATWLIICIVLINSGRYFRAFRQKPIN